MKISCSNGVIDVEKGLIKKIEETWYGDQFEVDEKLSYISETGAKTSLKFENARIEPKIKTVQFHWPESDKIGFREGYSYDKNLRAHVSKKKLVDFAQLDYSMPDDTRLRREMDIFFLKKSKFSTFGMNIAVTIEGGQKGTKGVIQWDFNAHTTLSFLKRGLQYVQNPKEIDGATLGNNTIWFGDTHFRLTNAGQLLAATTYQNNRTKIIEICVPEINETPENLKILFKETKDEVAWHVREEISPVIQFKVDLKPGQTINFYIELRFIIIPERKMNSVCFIVPDSEEYWPCALACAATVGEKREHFSAIEPHSHRLNVLNPIMWYREGEPLDASIYEYLLNLREIDKICLFGVPRIEDIQQLIIMLLDRGSELSELDFYIFTKTENLKELYARKEEIAEVVLKASEKVDVGIIEVIKNIIKIYPIPDLLNASLDFRRTYYKDEILSKYDRPASEFLIAIPNDPCIASITIPLARQLQAPIVIYREIEEEIRNLEELLTDFKGKSPLAIIIHPKTTPKISKQLEKLGYSNISIEFKDEFDLAIQIAQIFETFKIFNWGFELSLQQRAEQQVEFRLILQQIDTNIGKIFQTFLEQEMSSTQVNPTEYFNTILDCARKHFDKLISAIYEKWGHLEEVVFNSAVICEKMAEQEPVKRRCYLLMAGNYAFYRNAPLFPIKPTSEELELKCRNFYEELDNLIGSGANPAKPLMNFGKELFNQLIPLSISGFLRTIVPNTIPYFTVWSVPLELIIDGHSIWSLYFGMGRMSGLDQFSTALLTNLAVSLAPVPKESLKILLIANPTLDLPDASKELVQLTQRLTDFEIETIEGWNARERNVIMSINRGPNIIHYSGHGYLDPILSMRSGLILTDSRLTAFEISHLKLWTNPLVFTNACLSAALGTAFLHGGACFFVSPLWSVTDFGALEYAYTFYSAIVSGWSLGDAQKIAKIGVSNLLYMSREFAQDFTWLAYSCIGDPAYSLIYTKPWEKHVFGELIYASDFVRPKSLACARMKVVKPTFSKILKEIKSLAVKTGDSAFQPIIKPLENFVESLTGINMDNWQKYMEKIVGQLESLDNLAIKIDNLDIQDRVRQLLRMTDKAAKI